MLWWCVWPQTCVVQGRIILEGVAHINVWLNPCAVKQWHFLIIAMTISTKTHTSHDVHNNTQHSRDLLRSHYSITTIIASPPLSPSPSIQKRMGMVFWYVQIGKHICMIFASIIPNNIFLLVISSHCYRYATIYHLTGRFSVTYTPNRSKTYRIDGECGCCG